MRKRENDLSLSICLELKLAFMKIMKSYILVVALLLPSISFTQCLTTTPTYRSVATGTGLWTTAGDWLSQPPYALSGGAYLVVNGTLAISGQLNMDAGATITVGSGGLVTCCTSGWCGGSCVSCGSSDKIDIGATHAWAGGGGSANATGPFAGPTTLNSGGLPVVLDYFNALVSSNKVSLEWKTDSEINFNYFSLERSIDGKSFDEIAQIKGHGTTNEAHKYAYEDNDPIIGRSYYRLTSNDFDGYQETFRVVSVEYHGEKKFHISPNPSDGSSVKFNFNFENDADAQVIIYDNLGSAIGSYHVFGNASIDFENSLKSGVYLAKYTSATFTKTERFLVK